jgi:hypothetical protein
MDMEEKNQPVFRGIKLWIAVFGATYVAVLPMANTIALRNLALLGVLLGLAWCFRETKWMFNWPASIILWAAYLCVFPLISNSGAVALESLLEQWGRGPLAMLAGGGMAAVFWKQRKKALLYMGLASAVPIVVHLLLFAWKWWATSSIPWGYWGRETHHADIGYAAFQTVVLLVAYIGVGNTYMRPLVIAVVIGCLVSTALAHSRAGLVFSLLAGFFVAATVAVMHVSNARKYMLIGSSAVLLLGVVLLSTNLNNDPRWRTMGSELMAGFHGNALELECHGMSSIQSIVSAEYGDQTERILNSLQYGDGARVILLRTGVSLAVEYPWGSDGSRQAFQKMLRKQCPNPAISMAHTHNGWLDTVLALGWLGALLYFNVLVQLARRGIACLRQQGLQQWEVVLFTLAILWIVRGFTDSVFRDHMLEMQGLILAYALVSIRKQQS